MKADVQLENTVEDNLEECFQDSEGKNRKADFPKEEGRINVTETIIANKEENLPDL